MIRINLLPPAERLAKWRSGRIFTALSLLVVLLWSAVYGLNSAVLYSSDRQLREIRNRYEALRPTREMMQQASAKQDTINRDSAVMANLAREKIARYPVLAEISAKTPPQLWLTDLAIEKDSLKLRGMAKSYPELVTLIRNLEQDAVLAEPTLIKAERDGALPADKFEMTIKIRGKSQ